MIDIHNHLLYGLDDGARTIEETKQMIDISHQDGITSIIFTPHYIHNKNNYNLIQMQTKFDEIKKWVEALEPPIKLYLGHEAFLDETLIEDLVKGKCKTLAGSRYILVEFYKRTPYSVVRNLLFQIELNGFVPIIAHCERLVQNKEDLKLLLSLKEKGCLIQINAGTILKPDNRWQKRWLYKLIKNKTISFISSDAHNLDTRKPGLKLTYNLIAKKFGEQIAQDIFVNNPNQIILNQEIEKSHPKKGV